MEFGSAVPVKVGVLSFVEAVPVSVGALGAVKSATVIASTAVPALVPSDAESVSECDPELLASDPAVTTTPDDELMANKLLSLPAVIEYINVLPASASVAVAVTNCVPAESVSFKVEE